MKAFESEVGSDSKLDLDKGNQIIDAKHNVTVTTTKVHPSEPKEPEEGEHYFHFQMWMMGSFLHFIIDIGSQNNLI